MKQDQIFKKVLSILCLLAFVLAACAPAATQTTAPDVEEPAATEPAATEPAVTEPAATEPAAAEPVTLTYLVDDSQNTRDTTTALVDAYVAQHPNVTINIETRPGGTEATIL